MLTVKELQNLNKQGLINLITYVFEKGARRFIVKRGAKANEKTWKELKKRMKERGFGYLGGTSYWYVHLKNRKWSTPNFIIN